MDINVSKFAQKTLLSLCCENKLFHLKNCQCGLVVKSVILMTNSIDKVTDQNLFALFICVFEKLQSFILLGGLSHYSTRFYKTF